jgi:curved DNA-binding protein CbpA
MMLSKKPALLLHSYSSLSPLCSPSPSTPARKCTTSCRYPRFHFPQTRSYAQHAADSSSHGQESDLSWPDPVYPHKSPTPYQILHCKRSEAYTKQRFIHLVKLYHPDRCGPSSPVAHLPHSLRIERYRLLITAHSILSDDAKRKEYDAWGHGWAGHHQTPSYQSAHGWAPEPRRWPPGHDPMNNATWEDWERWHKREESGTAEEPRDQFMINLAFVALVFSLVSIGGVMQGTRASMLTSSAMEHHDKIHKNAAHELARSKRATVSGDRNERIRTFLEHREAINAGEVAYQRLLPPSETCAPDATVRKQ